MNKKEISLELKRRCEADSERSERVKNTSAAIKSIIIESGMSNEDAIKILDITKVMFTVRLALEEKAKDKQT